VHHDAGERLGCRPEQVEVTHVEPVAVELGEQFAVSEYNETLDLGVDQRLEVGRAPRNSALRSKRSPASSTAGIRDDLMGTIAV
jgi:hypothetical protein